MKAELSAAQYAIEHRDTRNT